MFILYFALWVILNGRWTTEIGVLGVLFAAVMYVFSCKFIGFSLSVDFQLFRRIPSAIGYGFTLLKEIVKANIAVLKLILDKNFEPKPQLVHFDAVLRRDRHLVTLANSITLTPGTITVELQDNHFLVHCLDERFVEGLDSGVMVRKLEKMELRHPVENAVFMANAAPAADAAPAHDVISDVQTERSEEGNADEH